MRRRRSNVTAKIVIAATVFGALLAAAHHGHHCTGDNCTVCLAIHWAQAIICASAGFAVVLPSLLIVAFVACVTFGFVTWKHHAPRPTNNACLVAITPVTNRVKLLI